MANIIDETFKKLKKSHKNISDADIEEAVREAFNKMSEGDRNSENLYQKSLANLGGRASGKRSIVGTSREISGISETKPKAFPVPASGYTEFNIREKAWFLWEKAGRLAANPEH